MLLYLGSHKSSELNEFRISFLHTGNARCLSTINTSSAGFTTEIYVAPIPDQISVGSSIGIGTKSESSYVFKNENILRIERD